jgi:hypothetical protein
VDKVNYNNVVRWLKIALWVTSITLVSLLLGNLAILFCTIHWKVCHSMNCVSKILMTLLMTFGGIVCSMSIAYMVFAIVSSNICSLFKEALESKTMLKNLVPEPAYKFAEACIYSDSKGELTFLTDNLGAFGDQIKQFDDL